MHFNPKKVAFTPTFADRVYDVIETKLSNPYSTKKTRFKTLTDF